MPTNERLGPDDREDLQDRRNPAVQLDKEPAIIVREPDATMQATIQDNQLMSKHRVLSFKPQLRLEWRGQNGQNETEQPGHSASLGDSITSSTQIRFSVHTAVTGSMFGGAFISCSRAMIRIDGMGYVVSRLDEINRVRRQKRHLAPWCNCTRTVMGVIARDHGKRPTARRCSKALMC